MYLKNVNDDKINRMAEIINLNDNKINHMAEIINDSIKYLPNFDLKDQLIYIDALMTYIETADEILSKYDGRKYRMMEVINKLNDYKEDKDEND